MPVDMGAVGRAANMPEQAPMGEQAPEANPLEELSTGLQAITAFVQARAGQGDPAAQEAQAALQALIMAMSKMGQGEGMPPPEGGMGAPPGGQVPLNKPATVLT